jgi:hypothetical protein
MDQPDRDTQAGSLLKQYLAERDVSCPVCGYNLRGLDSQHCPECGMRLEVRIGASDLRLGAWLAVLLSVGLPCGFFLILLAVLVVLSLYYEEWPPAAFIFPLAAAATIYALCVWGVLARRRRFWRQRRGMERLIPAGLVLSSILGAAATLAWLWYVIQNW